MTNKSDFIWHNFDTISKEELYDVLSLRQRVFIIEQNCFYEDLDYSDREANHLLLYKDNKLIGYSRVFPPGIKYDAASIGRIVVDEKFRSKGYGKIITTESIEFIKNNWKIKYQRLIYFFYLNGHRNIFRRKRQCAII